MTDILGNFRIEQAKDGNYKKDSRAQTQFKKILPKIIFKGQRMRSYRSTAKYKKNHKNKNYLSLNTNCTANDLLLILQDQYELMETNFKPQSAPRKIKSNMKNSANQIKNIRKSQQIGYFLCQDQTSNDKMNALKLMEVICVNNQKFLANKNVLLSPNYCKYVCHEFFYSNIDLIYFNFNEFKEIIQKVGLNCQPQKIKEWNIIRRAMGHTRRFSPSFLQQEQKKLVRFRQICREHMYNQYNIEQDIKHQGLLGLIKRLQPLQVGQQVFSSVPNLNFIQQGTILSVNKDIVYVRFNNSELAVLKVPDSNVYVQDCDMINLQEFCNPNISVVLKDINYQSMSLLLKLLERKTILVNQLRKLNDEVEKNKKNKKATKTSMEEELDKNDLFGNIYGWTGIQIKIVDQSLKHTLTKFRLRGINDIGINLQTQLLQGFQNEEESSSNNQEALQQSRLELQMQQQNQTEKDIELICCDCKDQRMKPLISGCIGIMLTLMKEGDIDLNKNSYVQQVADQIYSGLEQYFFAMNETLVLISNPT